MNITLIHIPSSESSNVYKHYVAEIVQYRLKFILKNHSAVLFCLIESRIKVT